MALLRNVGNKVRRRSTSAHGKSAIVTGSDKGRSWAAQSTNGGQPPFRFATRRVALPWIG